MINCVAEHMGGPRCTKRCEVPMDCGGLPVLERMMEEMAGAPKEEMGKRQPGEKGMYERYRGI